MPVNEISIVEKTKRMLGKNYRGDKEIVPVYSTLIPIEGKDGSFLAISNDGFTDKELDFINECTRNYSWWVANHGYLIDEAMHEIPALFVYGSEVGEIPADVLNFTGFTINNFYTPVERTDKTGNVNMSLNHLYVQFLLDGELLTSYIDNKDITNGVTINDKNYEMYPGRLSNNDKKVVDGNVVYPINLISNLEYYHIPTVGELGEEITGAHDATKQEKNNLEILEDVCEMVAQEAAEWTNRPLSEKLIRECWPVIVKCSCIAYLNRGSEGLISQSELGQQNAYVDWVEIMHKQLVNRRYIL